MVCSDFPDAGEAVIASLTLPVVSSVISPYTHLVYTSQHVTEAARPPQAPEMAAVAVHFLQDKQHAIGTTAEPISTPMSRYTYLHSTAIPHLVQNPSMNVQSTAVPRYATFSEMKLR